MGWLVPYSSLTPEQQQAVMLPLEGHRVIVGGPGAGKTLVLLHRFSYLFQLHGSDPAVGKLFVFTTTLKDFIRSALTEHEAGTRYGTALNALATAIATDADR